MKRLNKSIFGRSTAFIIILVMLITLITTAGFAAFSPAPPAAEKVDLLIGFEGTPNPGLVRAFGGEIYAEFEIVDVIAARMPPQAAEALSKNPSVRYVETDGLVYAVQQDVPWGIKRVFLDDPIFSTWDDSKGESISVAVLDTGIASHIDLKILGGIRYYIPNTGPPNRRILTFDNNYNDVHGHGTHVAGTIAALDNSIGVVGVAPATDLYAVKVLDDSGTGSISTVVAGIEWAVKNNHKIINMSLSGGHHQTLQEACDDAFAKGILLVAAAGNDGATLNPSVRYPAAYNSVIAVAASDSNDRLANFSNYGSEIELIAPGVGTLSTFTNNGYATFSGTSMASPHVAGVAALVWAADSTLKNNQVRDILMDTAENLSLPLNHQGNGLVRADRAVAAVVGSTPIKVTEVIIDQGDQAIEIEIDETTQLTATVLPADATNKAVNWSSSNSSKAIVDSNGLVTGVAEGTATITVITEDGGKTDAIVINVTKADEPGDIAVTGVEIDQGDQAIEIEIDETTQLTATVSPYNATNIDVNWSSSDSSIAIVDLNGLVNGVAEGIATITVTTDDGKFTDSIVITVKDPQIIKPEDPTEIKATITSPSGGVSFPWNSWVDIAVKVTDQTVSAVAFADVTVIIMNPSGTKIATYNGTSNADGIFTARYRVPNKADTIGNYTITALAKKGIISSEEDSVIFTVTSR